MAAPGRFPRLVLPAAGQRDHTLLIHRLPDKVELPGWRKFARDTLARSAKVAMCWWVARASVWMADRTKLVQALARHK